MISRKTLEIAIEAILGYPGTDLSVSATNALAELKEALCEFRAELKERETRFLNKEGLEARDGEKVATLVPNSMSFSFPNEILTPEKPAEQEIEAWTFVRENGQLFESCSYYETEEEATEAGLELIVQRVRLVAVEGE